MKVVNFSEARNRLKSVLDQVVEDADYTALVDEPHTITAGSSTVDFTLDVTADDLPEEDGTLDLVLDRGYLPNLGDTFDVVTFTSASGTF